ncbi:MAG: hypothetical protein HFG27_04435 [Provencibacterium sp.]|jgi:hypothetical protein|nr:hypothetical protein [Provencibacterium sp.]
MSTFQADFARIMQLQTRLRASQMQIEMARSQIISAKSKLSGQSGFGLEFVKAAIQQEVKTTAEQRETAGRMRAFMGVVVDRTSQHENSAAGRLESTDIKKTIEMFIIRLRKILLPGVVGGGLGHILINIVCRPTCPPHIPDGDKLEHNWWENLESTNEKDTPDSETGTDNGSSGSPYSGMHTENRDGENFHTLEVNPLFQKAFTHFVLEDGKPETNVGCSVTAMMMLHQFRDPGSRQWSHYEMEEKMKTWWQNGTGAVWGRDGLTSNYVGAGNQNVLSLAVNQLKEGKPSIVHVKTDAGGTHYILVKGFREGYDPGNVTPGDILVQDPGFPEGESTMTLEKAMSYHAGGYLSGQIITY